MMSRRSSPHLRTNEDVGASIIPLRRLKHCTVSKKAGLGTSQRGGVDAMQRLTLNIGVVTMDECDHNHACYEVSRDSAL